MAESVAVMSSVPQRPPPPARSTGQVGVASTTHRQSSEAEDNFRIVDSRSKFKQRSRTLPREPSKDLTQSARPTSPQLDPTVIDSKHSPLLKQKAPAPARPAAPPTRPHPPKVQNTVTDGDSRDSSANSDPCDSSVGGDACDGGVSCDPRDKSDSGEVGPSKSTVPPTRPSVPPTRPQPPPPRPRSFTLDVDVGDGGDVGGDPCDRGDSGEGSSSKSLMELIEPRTRPQPPGPRPRSFTLDRDVGSSFSGAWRDGGHRRDSREGSVDSQTREVPADTEKTKEEDSETKGDQHPRPSRPPPPRAGSAPRARAQSLSVSKKGRVVRERSPTMDGLIRPPPRQNSRDVTPPIPPVRPAPLTFPTRPTSPRNQTTPPYTPSPRSPNRLSDPLEGLSEQPEPEAEDNTEEVKRPVNRMLRSSSSPARAIEAALSPPPPQSRSSDALVSLPTRHTPSPPTPPTQTSEAVTNTPPGNPPAVPRRPYLPPRPFPPRPNSANKQGPPPKPARTKRSPQHPTKRAPKRTNGTVEPSPPKKASDVTRPTTPKKTSNVAQPNSLSPTASSSSLHNTPPVSHDSPPVSHDSPGVDRQAALMMSVDESAFNDSFEAQSEEGSTPSLTITDQDTVQFAFPSDLNQEASGTAPNYESSLPATLDVSVRSTQGQSRITTETVAEERDQVAELDRSSTSPRFGGKKLINSMKKSFRSLRLPRRQHTTDDSLTRRRQSDGVVSTITRGASQDNRNYPDPLPQGILDPLVVKCVAYLNRESVLEEQGLFRVPGDVAAIKKLRAAFISGIDVNLEEVLDPHTVCGLLKLHLRELRVSLIPRGPILTELIHHVKQRDVESVCGVFDKIDVAHVATLRLVAELLSKVVAHSDMNRMTAGTLATSCGPSIFPYLPPSNSNQLLKFLIDNCTAVFT